jgi:tRNA(Ile)-lysidine synthase
MLKAFESNLIENGLLKKGDAVLIAVSGGVDSMVLLNLFGRLRKKWRLDISAAHVNHKLRGRHSDLDENLVRNTCKKMKIPFYAAYWKAPKKGNIQDLARQFRYDFFKSVGKKTDARILATAHHGDDQAETVLLKMVRGSGINGISGIRWISRVDDMRVIRPLLNFGRREIETYAKRFGLPFRHDDSNDKTYYLRNKIRRDVLPLLETINPRVKESLSDIAMSLQTNFAAIEIVAKTFAHEYFTETADKIIWGRGPFLRLPTAIRRQVIIEAFERLAGSKTGLNADQIGHMESISKGTRVTAKYMLPQKSLFERSKDLLCIRRINA